MRLSIVAVILAALAGGLARISPAQAPTGAGDSVLSGRVLQAGEPVAGAPVTLHRVSPQESGVIAQASTDASGAFRFQLPPPDTSAFTVFFATVDHLSVRYFGIPVHRGQVRAPYTVEVFDTTSAVPPGALRVVRRDVVLVPGASGGWEVDEILRIRNAADRSLVSRDGKPVWEFAIPAGAENFEVGEAGFTPNEVQLMGERVLLTSSLVPGDRELLMRYRIPAGVSTSEFLAPTATDTFNVFVRQPAPAVEVDGLATTDVVEVSGERFVQFGGTGLARGARVRLQWSGPAAAPVDPIVAGVSAAVLLLLVGTWAAFRHGGPRSRERVAPGLPSSAASEGPA